MPEPFVITQITDLFIVKHGFFKPVYKLEDGNCTYGELAFHGFLPRKASVKTAFAEWEILPGGFFERKTIIQHSDGIIIGEATSAFLKSSYTLQLNDGRVFKFSRPSFWSSFHVWLDTEKKQLVSFKFKPFSKKQFEILYDKNSTDNSLMLLLTFLGLYFLLSQQRRKAAAH